MKIHRFSIAVSALIVFLASQGVRAETSVHWNGEQSRAATGGDLRWSKPKSAQNVGPVLASPKSLSPGGTRTSVIQQVQHTERGALPPIAPPQPQSMTPAQRDLIYPERRPTQSAAPATPLVTPSIAVESKDPALERNAESATKPAPLPTSQLSSTLKVKEIECPSKQNVKSIKDISVDIKPMPMTLPKECPLHSTDYSGRHYSQTCFQWKAAALCTKGAYFEDVQLERYGHSVCPALEPVISGARFFLTVPMLPYKMGLQTPDECVYTLGHYRAGSCAPHMLDPFPISVRAMLFEGAAVAGAVALIP